MAVFFEGKNGINQKISKLASFGNNVYTFYPETCCNISQANETCNKYNGFLAHVKTENVQTFITQQIEEYKENNYKGFWIGLHRIGDNNKEWEWSDKSKLGYSHWAKGDPNALETCVLLLIFPNKLGFWSAETCAFDKKFLCENSESKKTVI